MSASARFRLNILPALGLIVGPAAWAAGTQAGQILPYLQCGSSIPATALLSAAGVILSLLAGIVSWRSGRRPPAPGEAGHTAFPRSLRFVAALSGLCGLIFAFALFLQGAASIWLSGCER